MRSRVATIALVTLGLVAAGALFAFAFGTPQAPEAPASGVTTASAGSPAASVDGVSSAEDATVVPAPDPSSPLAVEIPGCVCHSDDPELVAQHAEYRMNQCFGCHAGGMPEMGE